MKRPEVGEWFRDIRLSTDWVRNDRFTKVLEIDCFRLTRVPPEGIVLQRGRDYEGIRFRLSFKVPFIVETWR